MMKSTRVPAAGDRTPDASSAAGLRDEPVSALRDARRGAIWRIDENTLASEPRSTTAVREAIAASCEAVACGSGVHDDEIGPKPGDQLRRPA